MSALFSVPAQAGGSMMKIGVAVVAAGTMTFTIPGGYTGIYIELHGRSDDAGAVATLTLRINGDSGANYDSQAMAYQASGAIGGESLGATSLPVGYMPTAAAAAGIAASLVMDLPFYAGTTFQKTVQSRNAGKYGTSTTNFINHTMMGAWRNTAAITSVVITLSAGNWVAGSAGVMYGLR